MFNAATAIDRTKIGAALTGQTINALLLDDSKFDRLRIRRMSRESGIPIFIDEAVSLQALRLLLDEETFDVVLIDYRLDSGDGIEALEILRAHPVNSQCPAIMVTGVADPDVAVRAMRLGCSDYLAKSEMDAASLRASVVRAIDSAAALRGSDGQREAATWALVNSVLGDMRNSLQPELAAMVRAVRDLRARLDHPEFTFGAGLDDLESRAMALWSVINRMTEAAPGAAEKRASKRHPRPQ
jgi:CheY-like chemotaxis protein